MTSALIVLAAGKGSRMKSELPKVLHKIAGTPMVVHALRGAARLNPARTIVVTGHGSAQVRATLAELDPTIQCVEQTEQAGTAHAVAQAKDALADFDGDAFVLYGDTPFISGGTLEKMHAARVNGHDVVVLGFHTHQPAGYGRLIVDDNGALEAIIEEKEATPQQKAVTFCNSGVMCADRQTLFSLIEKVGNNNAKGEYYLTDIVSHGRAQGMKCAAVSCDEVETMGVNSRADLATAEAAFQAKARRDALAGGATMMAPETVWFSYDTALGQDIIIEPNVVLGPKVTIANHAIIRAFSHLEGCHVGQHCIVGPYARLRPGTTLADGARVGNFVEIKSAQIGEGAKVNHLSYVGDATVGKAANIGAGSITCNYDGVFKHHTEIGERAFIGSNTALVAPVRVGDDAMTGSGSVITKNVPDGDLGLSRAKQENKPGLALRLMNSLKALKAKKQKG